MNDTPVRRTISVLLAYGVGAWLVVVVARRFRAALALPEIFEQLLHAGLVLGVPLAAVLAWMYPSLGHDVARPARETDGTDGAPLDSPPRVDP